MKNLKNFKIFNEEFKFDGGDKYLNEVEYDIKSKKIGKYFKGCDFNKISNVFESEIKNDPNYHVTSDVSIGNYNSTIVRNHLLAVTISVKFRHNKVRGLKGIQDSFLYIEMESYQKNDEKVEINLGISALEKTFTYTEISDYEVIRDNIRKLLSKLNKFQEMEGYSDESY